MRVGVTGLGLVANGKRNIASGTQFDKLYDRAGLLGTNPIIGNDFSDTYDTLNRMADIVRKTLNDTAKVAPVLQGRNQEETLRNVWNHVYNHFQYEKDAMGIEQLRRPARSWVDRRKGIDCDCMSILISSLLHHLRLSHTFRKAEYNSLTGWQHVYVVVPKPGVSLDDFTGANPVARNNYYVLDCVVDKFDYEVSFNKKFDKVMKIQYLNGLDLSELTGGITPQAQSLYQSYPAAPNSVKELFGSFGCEFNGLDGLYGADAETLYNGFMRMLKQHLVNTRSIVSLNPALTVGLYNPTTFIQRLDQLIAVFDDPAQRTQTLNALAALESRDGLSGPFGNIFKKVGSAIKTVAQKVSAPVVKVAQKVAAPVVKVAQKVAEVAKPVVQKAATAVATGAKKVGTAVVTAVKSVAKVLVRYNPATAAVRNGLILAMRTNLFRMAEKLGYGYWMETEANRKGLDLVEWRKTKETLGKLQKMHKALGGKVEKLDAAIKAGWKHGVEKHGLIAGLGQYPMAKTSPNRQAAPKRVPTGTPVSPARMKQAKVQITSAMPLLQMAEQELEPIKYSTILRTHSSSELETFLQAIRTNQNGLATKLSLAYKPAEEAKNYDKSEYKKLLDRARKVESMVTLRGGTTAQLREAVEAGKKVAVEKKELGAVAVSAAAASAALTTVAVWLRNIDFSKMFKGKATSPMVDDATIKNTDITGELTEDEEDEGDSKVSATNLESILQSFSAQDTAKKNPVVATLTNVISQNPGTTSLAAKILTTNSPAIKTALTNANPGAAKIAEAIKKNPVATALAATVLQANKPVVKSQPVNKNVVITPTTNPAAPADTFPMTVPPAPQELAEQIMEAVAVTNPTSVTVAEQLIETEAGPELVAEFTQPGIVPVQESNGSIATVPVAEAVVVDGKTEKKSNTMKYVAIAGAGVVALGVGYLVMRKPAQPAPVAQVTQPAPAATPVPDRAPVASAPAPALSGAPKKTHRTRKVMAITIN